MLGLLSVSETNGRYLVANGSPIFLAGFHTWNNVQESGASSPPDPMDWQEYLAGLTERGLNFTKLWTYESPRGWGRYRGIHRYVRTGPGNAADGGLKFDLDQINQAWLTRLRARAIECLFNNVYVCVQLFQGWDIEDKGIENSWPYHPYHASNNINSVDGDYNADGDGEDTQIAANNPVLAYQEALVEAVIDAVGDLPNVIWEISNEPTGGAGNTAWQEHIIDHIQTYEATKPLQHLIGFTVQYPSGSNATLSASSANWVSYSNRDAVDGTKISMSDTDHVEGLTDDHTTCWVAFCNGHGGAWYMDSWDGGGYSTDTRETAANVLVRDNLGYLATLVGLIGDDLLLMTPQASLSTSGHCLARDHATEGKYVAYYNGSSTFNLDLSTATGTLSVRWLRLSDGTVEDTATVSGGDTRTLTSPWTGAVVAYVRHG